MLLYNFYQTAHIFFWSFVVYVHGLFLGAFAKLQKATNLRRVCPSSWNNSAATARIFVKLDI
jgi:hypothetical protein